MKRAVWSVRDSWLRTIRAAIILGEADAAYRLTVAYVRRLRELGVMELWN